ncbi:hypothetical protein TNCV_2976611 [Trichonephila clavipes]|nr:hypothetical protein TNCV_2976611 [Trichonephila clavipes]
MDPLPLNAYNLEQLLDALLSWHYKATRGLLMTGPRTLNHVMKRVPELFPCTSELHLASKRKKPAPTGYTTNEEDMITYVVEEDEQHPDRVKKDWKQYWKGSLYF